MYDPSPPKKTHYHEKTSLVIKVAPYIPTKYGKRGHSCTIPKQYKTSSGWKTYFVAEGAPTDPGVLVKLVDLPSYLVHFLPQLA